jgi:hypothetical protein
MRTRMLIIAVAGALLIAAAVVWGAGDGGSTTLANPGVTVGVDTMPRATPPPLSAVQTSKPSPAATSPDITSAV